METETEMETERLRAENVGVLALEAHFPAFFVDQAALERHDGVPSGKYTLGLGQRAMAFPGDREDVNALALTAVARLLERYGVDPRDVGRLEVGSETLADKAKSTKTVLMSLFEPLGNTDVDGATVINACYGATAALLNAAAWVESSAWDGRLAVVVAADIAVYRPGPARPSGGCGAVAMLVGPDAPLALDMATKATHASHIWDFFKPDPTCEYATVDGARSQTSYLHALDQCYAGYCAKNERREARRAAAGGPWSLSRVDYAVFHSPYHKLVQKSFARLMYLDAVRAHADADADAAPAEYEPLRRWTARPVRETLADRELDLAARAVAKEQFALKVSPGCAISQQVGNCYAASVYLNLATLVHARGAALAGKRVLLYSYGSGSMASMFSLRARRPAAADAAFTLDRMARVLDLPAQLAVRAERSPEEFAAALALRERAYVAASAAAGAARVELTQSLASIAPGAFYLDHVDALGRREYKRRPAAAATATAAQKEPRSDLPAVRNRLHDLAGAVYVVGTSAGFPPLRGASAPSLFSHEAMDAVLRGENLIERLGDEMLDAQLALGITPRRRAGGERERERVETRAQCVQVAAAPPRVDLTAPEYGLPAALVRGMDEATQLAVAAGLKALERAGLVGGGGAAGGDAARGRWRLPESLRDGTGVIYATSYPTMQAAMAEAARRRECERAGGDYELDPKLLFKVLVLANAQLAQITGARGPNAQTNAACAGATQALGLAQQWIAARRCARVLVVASDCASSAALFPWIGGGFRGLGAASVAATPEAAARPFDAARNGMIVGAGATGVVLEAPAALAARTPAAEPAAAPSRRVKLLASHFCNSAFHGAALDPQHVARELDRFLARVERELGISRAQFAAHGVYYSHETGTNASPETSCAFAEVTALRAALGDALLRQLVVANTKGITGHPMAVSFEDVVAVEGLRRGCVPPVVHFSAHDPSLGEEPLNLAAGGPLAHKYALRFAAGFGSQLAFTFYALEE